MDKQIKLEDLSISVRPAVPKSDNQKVYSKYNEIKQDAGRKTLKNRLTQLNNKNKSIEKSVIRKSIALMKECAQPVITCKRELSKRTIDSKTRHEERMKKARTSRSPTEEKVKVIRSTSKSSRKLSNNTSLSQINKNFYSSKYSDPTYPSTPQFNGSKANSIYAVPSSRVS